MGKKLPTGGKCAEVHHKVPGIYLKYKHQDLEVKVLLMVPQEFIWNHMDVEVIIQGVGCHRCLNTKDHGSAMSLDNRVRRITNTIETFIKGRGVGLCTVLKKCVKMPTGTYVKTTHQE